MTQVSSTSLNHHQSDLKIKSDTVQTIALLEKLQSFDPALHGGELLIDAPIGHELIHEFKSQDI
ncbi:hypothetical protein [Polynucleobacter sp.]|uniref:hypothetical protein n=1 Tax=Polynucleobacter sp. TaxID=2029855 RepID=UPI0027342B02|nr:hypothetical protein [Polynucleobacter sp.]MDP3121416.1 hypothetical protein [Polynucleobacter sp.]